MVFFRKLVLTGCAVLFGAALIPSVRAQSGNPASEELIQVGPGFLTKGYKTIINGQVVQTTDGRVVQPIPPAAPTGEPPATPSLLNAQRADWPELVAIEGGIVVDPRSGAPVNNLPPEAELIPVGLRQVEGKEAMIQIFRVKAATPSAPATAPGALDPEEIVAPSITDIAAQANAPSPDEESVEPEEESGGFFDFLFGDGDEPELDENQLEIDLSQPLTEEEVMALKNDPAFQRYAHGAIDSSRHYAVSSRRGAGVRSRKPKLPQKITVEKFNAEEWKEQAEWTPGPTPPTPNIAIGKLVSVDSRREIAVCWLQTRYLQPLQPMVTRNYEMDVTGVLMPSGQQDGRSVGFWIAEGQPAPGDEVIFPGPDYEELVSPWLDSDESE